MTFFVYPTAVGPVTVTCSEGAITGLCYGRRPPEDGEEGESPLSRRCREQLEEYFAGKRKTFDLPLDPAGTPFQRAVWQALRAIPYGQTCSYADIAARIGRPKACRAVGMANHRNPIAILIPCHRVIGKKGSLTGYAGGLEIKERLLELEREIVKK